MNMLHGMGWGMGVGWILTILLIGLIIWTVKAVLDSQHNQHAPRQKEDTPVETLKRRYAQGEIDRDEYEEKKHQLLL